MSNIKATTAGRSSAYKSVPPPSVGRTVWEYAKSLGIALLLAIVIKTSIVEAYKIPSGSMEDTLLVGDFLLANKFLYGSRLPLVGIRLPELRDPGCGRYRHLQIPRKIHRSTTSNAALLSAGRS